MCVFVYVRIGKVITILLIDEGKKSSKYTKYMQIEGPFENSILI